MSKTSWKWSDKECDYTIVLSAQKQEVSMDWSMKVGAGHVTDFPRDGGETLTFHDFLEKETQGMFKLTPKRIRKQIHKSIESIINTT